MVVAAWVSSACSSESPPAEDAGFADAAAADSGPSDSGPVDSGASPALTLVGRSDLAARGMNGPIALANGYAYIGSRTDGDTHANAGVLIVDVRDPSRPELVGAIGQPDEDLLGMTSREMRAIPDRNLLIVMNISCGTMAACGRSPGTFPTTGGAAENDNLKLYDLSDPVHPRLLSTYDFGVSDATRGPRPPARPHEFFVWRDRMRPERVLIYVASPGGGPDLQVLDATDTSSVHVVATWDAHRDGMLDEPTSMLVQMHSITVSDDGRTGYVAYYGAGFFMIDTSDLATDVPSPQIRVLTPLTDRLDYSPPYAPGTHTALPIPGRELVLLTDEIFPIMINAGCPYGWVRLVDVADPLHPRIAGELELRENQPEFCAANPPTNAIFTSHNVTVTANLAIVSWYSAGLIVADTADAASPSVLATFLPEPLASVATEDPTLGGHPVTMWSYPIVKDGLIYVVDIRNGLYVLRYTGEYQGELDGLPFREGNSNLR
jgi:hypothetical protein